MSIEEKNIEQENMTPAERVRSDWRSLVEKMSYTAIVSNIPFLTFLALLGVLYIGNSRHAIDMQKELNARREVLKELRWKYQYAKSNLRNEKSEAKVLENASKIGLMPSLMPAYKIKSDSFIIDK